MRAFLSHNSRDREVAETISRYLLGNGIDVWLDAWELYPGDSLIEKIEQALEEVSTFIVLISKDSIP